MGDTIASLRRELIQLEARVRQANTAAATVDARQTKAIVAVAGRSQRTGLLIDPLPAGFTTQPITWPTPFPDDVYLVIPTVVVTSANLGQVFIQAGAKTPEGCTLVIRNTSGVAVQCIVDVLAIRT